jgi:hypothetical protein
LLGEYSLARSYWLHTVFIGWGVGALSAWTLGHVVSEQSPMRHLALALLTLQAPRAAGLAVVGHRHLDGGLAAPVHGRWALVGGAGHADAGHRHLGHDRRGLAVAARSRGMWTVASGGQPSPSFRLERLADGRTLAFHGGINEGAAAALEAELSAAPKLTTLLLDSPGGWIREGQRMAEVVRRRR